MPVSWTILIVLALSGLGYLATRSRAVRLAGGDIRKLHSRPSYYGWNAALLIGVPALFVTAIWRFLWPATSPAAEISVELAADWTKRQMAIRNSAGSAVSRAAFQP